MNSDYNWQEYMDVKAQGGNIKKAAERMARKEANKKDNENIQPQVNFNSYGKISILNVFIDSIKIEFIRSKNIPLTP